MNRVVKLCLVAGAGLAVLALAVSLLPVSRPQAQEGGAPPDGGRVSGEPAPAQPDAKLDAVSAHLQVAGSALRPENSADVEWAVPELNIPGCIYAESGDPYGYWNAPIYPPQGATLTKLGVYVYDASETTNAEAYLGVVDAYGTVVAGWNAYSSGSGGNSYFEVAIPNHQVDYAAYSYLLWWRPGELGTNMKICGFRLYYTPAGATSYLPAIMKDN
jgi:hypothetical protein